MRSPVSLLRALIRSDFRRADDVIDSGEPLRPICRPVISLLLRSTAYAVCVPVAMTYQYKAKLRLTEYSRVFFGLNLRPEERFVDAIPASARYIEL